MPADSQEKDLSPSQLGKIRRYLSDQGSLHRAIGSSLTTRRQSPRGRLLSKGNFDLVKSHVEKILEPAEIRRRVYNAVCVEFDWCNKKKQKMFQRVVALVKILLPILGRIPGIIANIVLMVTEALFDKLCECP